MKPIKKLINSFGIKYHYYLLPYIFIIIIVSISEVYITKLTGSIGQSAINQQSIQDFVIAMTILIIIRLIFNSLQNYIKKRQAANIYNQFKNQYTTSIVDMQYNRITKLKSGELLSIFTNDLKYASELLSDDIPTLLFEFTTFLISILFMASISLPITFLFIVLYPLLSFIQLKISNPIQHQMVEVSKNQAEYNHILINSLNNATTISAFNLEEDMLSRFTNSYDCYYEAMSKYIKTFLQLIVSSVFFTTLPIILCYIGAAKATLSNSITIADFIVFTTLANNANSFLSMLSQRLNDIQTKKGKSSRVLEIMNEEKEDINIKKQTKQQQPINTNIEILLQNISFGYEGNQLFNNFTLSIDKGSKIAIIGDSGCGKSTLLKIILSLLDIQQGSIYINNINTTSLNRKQIRELISYVPQNPYIYPCSIKENIILDKKYDYNKLIQACNEAKILDTILELPNQFDFTITSNQTLSGGQMQRIAIARALYKDAPIMLFDEATSALDGIIEKEFLETCKTNLKDKTIVFVTHRQTTMNACDSIINLSNLQVAMEVNV